MAIAAPIISSVSSDSSRKCLSDPFPRRSVAGRAPSDFIPKLRVLRASAVNTFLRPEGPIQRAVLNRLCDVPGLDDIALGQIRNRAGDLQDAVVCARAQALLHHGALQQV